MLGVQCIKQPVPGSVLFCSYCTHERDLRSFQLQKHPLLLPYPHPHARPIRNPRTRRRSIQRTPHWVKQPPTEFNVMKRAEFYVTNRSLSEITRTGSPALSSKILKLCVRLVIPLTVMFPKLCSE